MDELAKFVNSVVQQINLEGINGSYQVSWDELAQIFQQALQDAQAK